MSAGCFSPDPHAGIPCTAGGECPDGLMCRSSSGTCEPTGDDAGGVDPATFFAALDGAQWLMPCKAPPNPNLCDANDFTTMLTMTGDSALYDVHVRIRGVMERGTYIDGDGSDPNGWYVGGRADNTFLTVASIDVNAPAGTFFLNSVGAMGGGLLTLDYTQTMRIAGNAQVKLFMSALDGRARADGVTKVAGVVTVPDPYLGQFAQIDVESVSLATP